MSRRAIVLGVCALGVASGVFSLHVAREEPAYSFAGASIVGAAALLGAGSALLVCGVAIWNRRLESRAGALLTAAGFAWFLLEWNNPDVGSSLAFTIGLCFYGACPPLVGHAVLAYPSRRVASFAARATLAVAYVGSLLVLGVLPAFFYNPEAQGCSQCPSNLLLVSDRGELAEGLTRMGVYLGVVWALALAGLALLRIVPAPNAVRPILAAGAVYLGFVAAMFAVSIDRGFLAPGNVERRLWLLEAAALVATALAVSWAWLQLRRARSKVARLVVDLAQAPPPGGLSDALAGMVGDPEVQVAYPLDDRDRLVGFDGRSIELSPHQEHTSLVRDGRAVAVLAHAPGLVRDKQLVEEVTAAARLALENERLQAEVRARLEELRASRARIVEAGDVERKRLERDLHDGAQQRLVGLSLSLRLALSQLGGVGDVETVARLEAAEAELREAIAELRELAHGIFPAVLADEGFAAAVEALAEEGRIPVYIRGLPEGRFPPQVETAAYTVVAEAARATAGRIVVDARQAGETLLVDVEAHDTEGLEVLALHDRVGALGGRLSVKPGAFGPVTIEAELPFRP